MSVSKQDIITAIKNSDTFLRVPELKGAKPRLNKNGSPFAFVGGFNMVFQLEHQNKKWAFRVWHVPMGEHKERYRRISKYLSEKKLPYFADFIYDEKGILVNGNLLDTIRMEWLEGKLLKEYLEENLGNKNKLTKLANDFLEMCKTLRENKISHGDLQEGNILIDRNGNIKLVDYDSICIPEIEGKKELVTGLKGYQHPSRFKAEKASLKADYFSELVIYLSILALSENSNLWNKYQVKDTAYLLFTETDFEDFANAEISNDLQKLSNSIKSLTRILNSYLSENNYLNLTPFVHYLKAPKIISFNTNEKKILKGKSIVLSWNIENFDANSLNNGIGNVTGKNSISVSPTQSTNYKLTTENSFGKTEAELSIEVLPIPIVKKFSISNHKIKSGKEVKIDWEVEFAEKVEIKINEKRGTFNLKDNKTIKPKKDTEIELIITALDGITEIIERKKILTFEEIEISLFKTNCIKTIETQPIELYWNIKNANEVYLNSVPGERKKIESNGTITMYPNMFTTYFIEARNDLFSKTSEKIIVHVDRLPKINLNLENIHFQIPKIEIDFSSIVNDINQSVTEEMKKINNPKKRFQLSNWMNNLFDS